MCVVMGRCMETALSKLRIDCFNGCSSFCSSSARFGLSSKAVTSSNSLNLTAAWSPPSPAQYVHIACHDCNDPPWRDDTPQLPSEGVRWTRLQDGLAGMVVVPHRLIFEWTQQPNVAMDAEHASSLLQGGFDRGRYSDAVTLASVAYHYDHQAGRVWARGRMPQSHDHGQYNVMVCLSVCADDPTTAARVEFVHCECFRTSLRCCRHISCMLWCLNALSTDYPGHVGVCTSLQCAWKETTPILGTFLTADQLVPKHVRVGDAISGKARRRSVAEAAAITRARLMKRVLASRPPDFRARAERFCAAHPELEFTIE